MKQLLSLFCIFFLGTIGSAQIDFGPRVGLGTVFTDVESTSESIKSGDAEFGFHVGFFTRFGNEKIKIMPELLYSSSTTSLQFNNGFDSEIFTADIDKLDVPVSIVFKPNRIINLQGGIVGSYILSDSGGLINSTSEAFHNYNDFTIGYRFGGGVELLRLIIDLQYEGSLSNLSNSSSIAGFVFDERISTINGSVGFKIF